MLEGLLEYDGGRPLIDGGRLLYVGSSGAGRKPSETRYKSGLKDEVVSMDERGGISYGSSAWFVYRGRSSDVERVVLIDCLVARKL